MSLFPISSSLSFLGNYLHQFEKKNKLTPFFMPTDPNYI